MKDMDEPDGALGPLLGLFAPGIGSPGANPSPCFPTRSAQPRRRVQSGLFGSGYAQFLAELTPETPFEFGWDDFQHTPALSLAGQLPRDPGVPDQSGSVNETATASDTADPATLPTMSQVRRQSADTRAVPSDEGGAQSDGNPPVLDMRGYDPGEALDPILIGNPAHPRLIREWEQRERQDWPRDPITGRRHDVAHLRAKADGGTDTLENIRPLHPLEHRDEHMQNGDYARWARRSSIARAFGGRVGEMLGPLGFLSDVLGILSGRIRTDNLDNWMSDLSGIPSQQDRQKALEDQQRLINPKWKPGDSIVI